MSLEEILKVLKEMKERKANLSYKEYWEEVNNAIIEENKIFSEMDEKMKTDWEKFGRFFTI